MLSDIELGLRARARAGQAMLKAFQAYADAQDLLSRTLARQQYEVYRVDYQALQRWLEVRMLCALLRAYGLPNLALSYDEVTHGWHIEK